MVKNSIRKSPFIWSLKPPDLAAYVTRQLNTFFPDSDFVSVTTLEMFMDAACKRTETCFSEIRIKYFYEGDSPCFNHLNSDHYAMFLYLLSNSIFRAGGPLSVATKVFLLNKALNGIDAFYSISLPEVFLFVHPVGTVLGNAKYGNYFAVYQNCSVGSDNEGNYPQFGDGILLYAGSSVIAKSHLGNNVVLGAKAFLINTDVSNNSLVLGSYPNHKIVPNERTVIDRIFNRG